MGPSMLKVLYAILLLLHVSGFGLGFKSSMRNADGKCREEERKALLNFKQSVIDSYDMLSTWSDHPNNTDCCNWNGVQCNHQTGYVHLLDLQARGPQYLKGAINLTSLIPLQYIQHLDVSSNEFMWNHIEAIASFTNLKYLNLSFSQFSGRIPFKLENLSLLECLDLGRNNLEGPIPLHIGNLRQLQYLDLGSNYLSGEIPFQLRNLKRLQFLNLAGNFLSGAIPFRNGNLPNLQTLRLSGDFDIEVEDSEWLSNLHSLTSLELSSWHNLSSSPQLLQTISELIPNIIELRLLDCSLLDTHIKTLFHARSNFSTSLSVLDMSSNMLTSSTFQLLFNFSLHLKELYLKDNSIALSSFLYSNFPSLNILDLSSNNLTSLVFEGNFNFGSKLRELYLQHCILTDQSFLISSASTINSSSSLATLDLSFNILKSSTIFYWLMNITTNLQILYLLDGKMLEGPIPGEFGRVMNSLESFHADNNRLQGKIPSFLGNMCRLQILYLNRNKLNGEISDFFQNSSSCNRQVLQVLDLSYNQITGKIPESIRLLSELEYLSLKGNSLEGDVTECHLSNFSKLETLSLSYNSLSVRIVSSWIPPFQLLTLNLASCKLGPSFPSWLQTQNSLVSLDISDNELNDFVPLWFWNNLQKFGGLNMSHNKLIGAIPDIPLKLSYKPSITLNSNQFEGALPSFLPQASMLLLSENKFSDLFSFLCNQIIAPNLATLDLANNQITGKIPNCWQSLGQLQFLDLSNNKLSGNIPISMGNLVNLKALVLRKNNLTGELHPSLKNCTNLIILDVSKNELSGRIPSWIGESVQQLIILNMERNHFSDNFPIQLCYLRHIQLLNLSKNKLSKEIPTCLKNFTAMSMSEKSIIRNETEQYLTFGYNISYIDIYGVFLNFDYNVDITWMWKGAEQVFREPQLNLKSIDLSSNHLTGEIPKEVVYLFGMVSLNLSRNNLSGEIPSQIGTLSSLESLDLSRNHLYGRVPSSLSQLDFLGKLDLSYNSLSGRIPMGRHLQTFEASSFEGNIDLCGEQLNKSCPGDHTTAKEEEEAGGDEDDSVFYQTLYMSMGVGFAVGFWGLIGPILIWKPWRIVYLKFLNRLVNRFLNRFSS